MNILIADNDVITRAPSAGSRTAGEAGDA